MMKVPRLLSGIVAFLLFVSLFRYLNGADMLQFSQIVARFSTFDFDLSPINDLVDMWAEADFGRIQNDASIFDAFDADSFWEGVTEFFSTIFRAIYKKLMLLSDTLFYFWQDGLSIFNLFTDLVVQTWDFILWILGYTTAP